jgi:hypothetical protein
MEDNPNTADPPQPEDDWATRCRGSHDDEYLIYAAAAQALDWPAKSYDQWLQS